MRHDFILAVKANQKLFGVELPDTTLEILSDYYELLLEHNSLLHLVAPCSPAEFAKRHILESLTMLEHLPEGAKFADVGAGAGLPSIPCLLARRDLKSVLIESKEKKAAFLTATVKKLELADRAAIVNRQFEEADAAGCKYIVCRALDKFTEKLPRLIKWSGKRSLLLFGGNNLLAALEKQKMPFSKTLLPLSEQRFLIVLNR